MGRDRSSGERRGQERGRDAPYARSAGRADDLRGMRDRARIAQGAARFIAEHGITDWSLARRKAARQLALPDSAPMPSNEEISQALTDHHALFGGEAHATSLRRQREEALAWMHRLAQWEPLLVGGVAAGWATEHSDVRLELVADDPKAVEMSLAGAGIAYVAAPPREDIDRPDGVTQLRIAGADHALRVSILSPQQRRHRPRKDDEPRLTAQELAALLAAAA
jgi:hypothetical protein